MRIGIINMKKYIIRKQYDESKHIQFEQNSFFDYLTGLPNINWLRESFIECCIGKIRK